MAYYIVAGLARYGGDDGLTIYKRSQFFEPINLSNKTQFYYICLFLLYASIYLVWRMVNSRFGMVIQGSRANDTRMRAIGFPTFRYKLTCFVIAGTLCGLAGALLANHTDFVSPAMMYWTRSGDLIIMVVLGGMGSVVGPVFGAVVLLRAGGKRSRALPSTGRSFLGRCCCWSCCSRVAASTAAGSARVRHADLLQVDKSFQALWRYRRNRRPQYRDSRRAAARGDRPEWCRQDHADRPTQRATHAGFRSHPV